MGIRMKTNSSKMDSHRAALLAKREELIELIYAHRSEIATDRKEYDQ